MKKVTFTSFKEHQVAPVFNLNCHNHHCYFSLKGSNSDNSFVLKELQQSYVLECKVIGLTEAKKRVKHSLSRSEFLMNHCFNLKRQFFFNNNFNPLPLTITTPNSHSQLHEHICKQWTVYSTILSFSSQSTGIKQKIYPCFGKITYG